MHIGQACAAIAAARKNICPQAPLVATMSAQFAFDALGETERRIDSVPLMGGAAGLGLGLALARPDLPVIVERAMYRDTQLSGGHDSVGLTTPRTTWPWRWPAARTTRCRRRLRSGSARNKAPCRR